MHENWQQAIRQELAQVPPGQQMTCTPGHAPVCRPLGQAGRALEQVYPLFPGLTFTRLVVQGEALSHRHPPQAAALELTHCRLGRVGWEREDGLTLYLGPGDLALHPMACCAHSVLRFPLEHYEGFSLSLDPAALAAHLPPVLAGLAPEKLLETFCPQGRPAALPARRELDCIFLPLYDLPEELRLPYYTLKAQELLLYLSRLPPPPAGGSQEYLSQQVELVRTIHDQLLAHPDRRVTIESLAKEHHLNASTLKAVFKAVYGQPIAAHMKHHRMQEAARLLGETDLSVGEIAQQVGYENQSKFSAVFRQTFQILPTEYRRQRREQSGEEEAAPCAPPEPACHHEAMDGDL